MLKNIEKNKSNSFLQLLQNDSNKYVPATFEVRPEIYENFFASFCKNDQPEQCIVFHPKNPIAKTKDHQKPLG